MKKCPGYKQPLLHAVRIMLDVVFRSFEQADLIQRLINSSIARTVESRCKREILSRGHTFIEILLVGNDAHERLESLRFSDNVTTSNSSLAATGSQLTG